MKMQYRITSAVCLIVLVLLFTAGIAIGDADNNTSNSTANANISNENVTGATGTAVETGNNTEPIETTVEPVVTNVKPEVTTVGSEEAPVMPDDAKDEPIEPADTVEEKTSDNAGENENPSSTPEQSPGFGIIAAIMVVLSAIHLSKKGR